MKGIKIILPIFTVMAICGLMAFRSFSSGTITGNITPTDGIKRVWTLSATDTMRATINNNGAFEIQNLQPGTYKIYIEATPLYQDKTIDNVGVTDATPTNLGTIELDKRPGQ